MAISFLVEVVITPEILRSGLGDPSQDPKISQQHNIDLLIRVSDEEVKKALFQMYPDKSPGPDAKFSSWFAGLLDTLPMAVVEDVVTAWQWKHARDRGFDRLWVPFGAAKCGAIWSKPAAGFIKINVDSLLFAVEGAFGYGALACDSDGHILECFALYIGSVLLSRFLLKLCLSRKP
uniref:Uncharacterized protein n=1 Tax=Cannabis sativa TaxID=3483 RepID=A0A803QAF1_CANSA